MFIKVDTVIVCPQIDIRPKKEITGFLDVRKGSDLKKLNDRDTPPIASFD